MSLLRSLGSWFRRLNKNEWTKLLGSHVKHPNCTALIRQHVTIYHKLNASSYSSIFQFLNSSLGTNCIKEVTLLTWKRLWYWDTVPTFQWPERWLTHSAASPRCQFSVNVVALEIPFLSAINTLAFTINLPNRRSRKPNELASPKMLSSRSVTYIAIHERHIIANFLC